MTGERVAKHLSVFFIGLLPKWAVLPFAVSCNGKAKASIAKETLMTITKDHAILRSYFLSR